MVLDVVSLTDMYDRAAESVEARSDCICAV